MSADAAPISASALRSSTPREFEIMDGLFLREQIADDPPAALMSATAIAS
jgi:hypothetical protein